MPLESSPETPAEGTKPTPAGEGATPPATDVKTPADPSPAVATEAKAKVEGEKGTMLDAVKAALKTKAKEEPPPSEPDPKSAAKPGESAKEGDKPGEETDDLTEEELARLKPKTAKRIKDLLVERTGRDQKIASLEPKATQFDRIVSFVQEAGLNPTEVNQLFDIGKNLKSNPRAAYDQIRPVYDQLQRMFGDVLPDDLQGQVSRGLITQAHAKELASTRTNAAVAEQNNAQLRQRDEQRRTQEATQALVGDVKVKVSEWEASQEKTDPDWKLKQPHIMRAVKVALSELRSPPTSAEAVAIAKKAADEINQEFKDLVPRKKEIRPVTNAAATTSTAKPTSLLEAARQGLAKVRAG